MTSGTPQRHEPDSRTPAPQGPQGRKKCDECPHTDWKQITYWTADLLLVGLFWTYAVTSRLATNLLLRGDGSIEGRYVIPMQLAYLFCVASVVKGKPAKFARILLLATILLGAPLVLYGFFA